jgi:FlaA1/EpsC-like NDP-sugar epimerase
MCDLVRLLGRDPIRVDPDGGYLTGRRVLVTGAGGSIGAELCRQITAHRPERLVMLGRGESTLTASAAAAGGTPRLALADIRDHARLVEVFAAHRPHVVFHAAALKHQPILEREPAEAVKTNVWGTANVLAAAADHGVRTLVNVSTDKACEPTCVLGASKRIAERMTAWHSQAGDTAGRWVSVRFGNVIGSRGSVLATFARQLASGEPLTVTDPRVSRYFMTAAEAAALVIHAGAVGSPGEALVLDMGRQLRIATLARRMAAYAGVDDPLIVYTGMRPGEKLHERLIGNAERPRRPDHPMIDHVDVPPLDPQIASTAPVVGDRAVLADALRRLCLVSARPAEAAHVG